MLTSFDRSRLVYDALVAGASGFLLKDLRRDQLIGAIRTAAAGDALLAPAVIRRLIERFCGQPPAADGPPESMAELTARELEVLKLVARGLSNRQIAESLFLTEATVKTHVAHVYAKLSVRDRVQAVVLAYETGLVHPANT
jgi:DNA-binding NarL/FixJ family response regulator